MKQASLHTETIGVFCSSRAIKENILGSTLLKMGSTRSCMTCLSPLPLSFRQRGERAVSSHQQIISFPERNSLLQSAQVVSSHQAKESRGQEEAEKCLPAVFLGRDSEHFITAYNWVSSVNTLYSGSQNCIQKGEICFLYLKIHFAVSNLRPCPNCT